MKIYAPFAGIVHYKIAIGEIVDTSQEVASVEAVKLEASVFAPGPGKVAALTKADFADVLGGDELLVLEEV